MSAPKVDEAEATLADMELLGIGTLASLCVGFLPFWPPFTRVSGGRFFFAGFGWDRPGEALGWGQQEILRTPGKGRAVDRTHEQKAAGYGPPQGTNGLRGRAPEDPRPPVRRGVGPVLEPFEGVKRIAVLRGGGLGDLMFAMPALDALAAAYPEAELTLLGTPLHAALLAGRPGPVDRVEVLPHAEGVRPGRPDPAALASFLAGMRARKFDLAVQVHGGGRNSNPFLLELGAAHTVGTRTPDAVPLERTIPYVYYQHEVLRALEVAGLAGAVPLSLEPQLEVLPVEEEKAAAYVVPGRDLVTLHPGATDPRRRWPEIGRAHV